jgi:hypothetical protein
MLYDFLLLELYYGQSSAGLFFEDLSLRYGVPAIEGAVAAGDIAMRKILMGPDEGRFLSWLTDQGRGKAQQS